MGEEEVERKGLVDHRHAFELGDIAGGEAGALAEEGGIESDHGAGVAVDEYLAALIVERGGVAEVRQVEVAGAQLEPLGRHEEEGGDDHHERQQEEGEQVAARGELGRGGREEGGRGLGLEGGNNARSIAERCVKTMPEAGVFVRKARVWASRFGIRRWLDSERAAWAP